MGLPTGSDVVARKPAPGRLYTRVGWSVAWVSRAERLAALATAIHASRLFSGELLPIHTTVQRPYRPLSASIGRLAVAGRRSVGRGVPPALGSFPLPQRGDLVRQPGRLPLSTAQAPGA